MLLYVWNMHISVLDFFVCICECMESDLDGLESVPSREFMGQE